VDTEDFPHLRARPTWVSADEETDFIQNEINIYCAGERPTSTIGRAATNDIVIGLQAVSSLQCSITYTEEKGWTISESKNE